MTLEELRSAKRDEILRLAAKRGARNVRVFGSMARGEDDAQSDIDILAVKLVNPHSVNELPEFWLLKGSH